MVTIYVDEHEPQQVVTLLQQSVTVKVVGLNRNGWADYMYAIHDGTEHVERKQVSEILADIDGVEDQLKREILAHKEARLWLLIEGIVSFSQDKIHHMMITGDKLTTARTYHVRPELWESWILALQRLGMGVVRTNHIGDTSRALAVLAKGGQAPHTTLNRPLNPRITYHQNPHVRTLLGIPKSGVGPVLAERLISEYGTVYSIIIKKPDQIADKIQGMNTPKAKQLLRALGRRV